jgi:hypothetical protein
MLITEEFKEKYLIFLFLNNINIFSLQITKDLINNRRDFN